MTRAKKKLVLTYARVRRLFGESRASRPSRFLAELPREVVRDASAQLGRDNFRAFAPSPKPAPAPSGGENGGFRPGLRVEHPTFGRGVVLQVQASGAQTRVVVFFDRAGRKTLLPQLAKLKVLEAASERS
jgi:DNA helicase-2/ATP-dependent DNA helicase PcrA